MKMTPEEKDSFLLLICGLYWEMIAKVPVMHSKGNKPKDTPTTIEHGIYRNPSVPNEYLVAVTVFSKYSSMGSQCLYDSQKLSGDPLFTKSETKNFDNLLSNSGRKIVFDKIKKTYTENNQVYRFQKNLRDEWLKYISEGRGKSILTNSKGSPEEILIGLMAQHVSLQIQKRNKEYTSYTIGVYTEGIKTDSFQAIIWVRFDQQNMIVQFIDAKCENGTWPCRASNLLPKNPEELEFTTGGENPEPVKYWTESEGYFTVSDRMFERDSSLSSKVDTQVVELLSAQLKLNN